MCTAHGQFPRLCVWLTASWTEVCLRIPPPSALLIPSHCPSLQALEPPFGQGQNGCSHLLTFDTNNVSVLGGEWVSTLNPMVFELTFLCRAFLSAPATGLFDGCCQPVCPVLLCGQTPAVSSGPQVCSQV